MPSNSRWQNLLFICNYAYFVGCWRNAVAGKCQKANRTYEMNKEYIPNYRLASKKSKYLSTIPEWI
jgi:hypothetical protein